jgi:thiol-disulfide isomerase/thioredoxin
MSPPQPTRRAALKGTLAGALALTAVRAAAAERPLFATGPLARNPVARSFRALDLPAPALTLDSAEGPRTWGDLKGKVRLVTLWAEWCAPCLLEAPDFAALHQTYGGPRFGVTAMLTASLKKLDVAGATATLARLKAASLPTWVEPAGGMRLFRSLATTANGSSSLPCTLIVDASGRIRGRALGAIVLGVRAQNGELSAADKARLLARGARTAWASPEAEALVRGLIDGALDG